MPKACNFIKKETLARVFSCEYFEIYENTFSYRTTSVAASVTEYCFLCIYEMVEFIRDFIHIGFFTDVFKGVLSGLTQFLATESPLKIMEKDFHFTLKALFILKIFKFLPKLFGHVEKRLE